MAHIIQIGNSFGVRIPKTIIQQAGFKENTDLAFTVTKDGLLISPEKHPRKDWDQKFKTSANDKKKTFLGEFANEFDKDEWEW